MVYFPNDPLQSPTPPQRAALPEKRNSFHRKQTESERVAALNPHEKSWKPQPYHIPNPNARERSYNLSQSNSASPSNSQTSRMVSRTISSREDSKTSQAADKALKKDKKDGRLASYVKTKTLNGAAHVLSAIGIGSTVPASPANLSLGDEQKIRARMKQHSISEAEIREEVKKFGMNFANFVPMRIIDVIFCEKSENENFFLEIIGSCESEDEIKDAFFDYLNKANLFFLTRWIAKICYILLQPFCQKAVQDATWAIFENLETTLDKIHQTGFNSLVSEGLDQSNQLFVNWITALESIAKNGEGLKLIDEVLKDELLKDKFYCDKPSKEFFSEVTTKLVDKYYNDISLGKIIYEKLTDFEFKKPPVPYLYTLVKIVNFLINIILFPFALAARIFFLLPDILFNYIVKITIKKSMISHDVLENGVQKVLETIGTNKGLSTPVLHVLNATLEELLLEVRDGIVDPLNDGNVQDCLSQNNKKALQRNVKLSLRAVDLYSHKKGKQQDKTVEDLQKQLKKGSEGNLLHKQFNKEIAKGIEDIIVLLYMKIKDPKYVKEKSYHLLKGINDSIAIPVNQQQEDEEFVEEEKKLLRLIQAIIVTSISNTITEKAPYLPQKSAARISATNIAFTEINPIVEKMLVMATSPNFLRFNLIFALNQFHKAT